MHACFKYLRSGRYACMYVSMWVRKKCWCLTCLRVCECQAAAGRVEGASACGAAGHPGNEPRPVRAVHGGAPGGGQRGRLIIPSFGQRQGERRPGAAQSGPLRSVVETSCRLGSRVILLRHFLRQGEEIDWIRVLGPWHCIVVGWLYYRDRFRVEGRRRGLYFIVVSISGSCYSMSSAEGH